ncbi:thiamine pyrophosphate-binding protein [Actinomyces sp. oral taxon 897]|uniref:thiamine pyrophosphate-binding protein n=1 Tax=Actinomyces sp. oral taxon 897 TaxID=2081702 RepID=UPI0020C492E8|nr:thiamine pyrophosphate-binding protein [Actinomyces sp. oral taxon 897]
MSTGGADSASTDGAGARGADAGAAGPGRSARLPAGASCPCPPSLQASRHIVAALVACGVRQAVLSPGSRCAPLAYALEEAEAAGEVSLRVTLDERSAGFIALGASRAHLLAGVRRPVAVVTTSGTAVANLHPAVAEADAAGVPLLVLSADRPHELVGTGANQTTEQTCLFGRAPRLVVDLPADVTAEVGRAAGPALAGQVRRAVLAAAGALSNDPGPAQVNVRLRPPLAPGHQLAPDPTLAPGHQQGPGTRTLDRPPLVPGPDPGLTGSGPGPGAPEAASALAASPAPVPPSAPAAFPVPAPGALPATGPGWEVDLVWQAAPAGYPTPQDLGHHRHGRGGRDQEALTPQDLGLVVAGDLPDPRLGALAVELADLLGWPLLAEPTSLARQGGNALPRYAELLARGDGADLASRVRRVVVVGHPGLSRPVTALLGREDLEVTVLADRAQVIDVAGTAGRIIAVRPGYRTCETLQGGGPGALAQTGASPVAVASALVGGGAPAQTGAGPGQGERGASAPPQADAGPSPSAAAVVRLMGAAPAPATWLTAWRQAAAGLAAASPSPDAHAPLGADAADGCRPDASCRPGPLGVDATVVNGGPAPRRANAPLDADAAALAVWRSCTGPGAPLLVLGSSTTIRRLDRLAPVGVPAPTAVANRGLAGIDGTVATAVGLALGARRPVRLLLGDLAGLHDVMSLGRGRHEQVPDLQVIVCDDAGGAIFAGLEYARVPGAGRFSRLFTTPQTGDLGGLAQALGARVHRPADLADLRRLLTQPVVGTSLVHLRLTPPSPVPADGLQATNPPQETSS